MRLVYVVLLAMVSCGAKAACEIEPGHFKPVLSAEAEKARNLFYVEQCTRAGGSLVDGTDPTLKGRLESPPKPQLPSSTEPYGRLAMKIGIKADPLLVFIIEADASVSTIAVIQSSGSEQFDSEIVDFCRRTKWRSPAKLDGAPIRSLQYMRYNFLHRSPR